MAWSIEPLGGLLLRYEIVLVLRSAYDAMSIPEIVRAIELRGFTLPANPNKVVSDALRWEVRKGRATKLRRGRYGAGFIPRSSEYRIRQRMRNTLAQAKEIRAAAVRAAEPDSLQHETKPHTALDDARAATDSLQGETEPPTGADEHRAAADSLQHETKPQTAPDDARAATDSLQHETKPHTAPDERRAATDSLQHETKPPTGADERRAATDSLQGETEPHPAADDQPAPTAHSLQGETDPIAAFWRIGPDGRRYLDLDAVEAAGW